MDKMDLIQLRESVFQKITKELTNAYFNGTIDDFLEKYDLKEENTDESFYYDSNNAKIIVIGDSRISKSDMEGLAKHNGINPRRIEFVLDYEKLTNFNFEKFRNNMKYSDILVGPIPHKVKGLDAASSFLNMVNNQPDCFPRVIALRDANELKITKQSFLNGLLKTRLFNEI